MISVEMNTGSIDRLIGKIKLDIPLTKISKAIQEDIIDDTKKRGWRRIGGTIKRRVIDKNTHEVFIGGKEKDAKISIYLNRGTKAHWIRPVKKLALSWVNGGTRYFSKGHIVSGIKATNFFKVYNSTQNKINKLIDETYKLNK